MKIYLTNVQASEKPLVFEADAANGDRIRELLPYGVPVDVGDRVDPYDLQLQAEFREALTEGLIAVSIVPDIDDIIKPSTPTRFLTPVATASQGNLTLAGNQFVDGVSTPTGTRVLVKNQTDTTQNGVYTARAGAWVRASDADTPQELDYGTFVYINGGSTQAGQGWVITSTAPIIGTDPIEWSRFSLTEVITAGDGLQRVLTELSVVPKNATVTVDSGGVAVGVITDTNHGQRAGGDLHADATTSASGFMSAADKVRLDGFVAGQVSIDVRNETGSPIAANKLVVSIGWSEEHSRLLVDLADKDTAGRRPALGITVEEIADDANSTAVQSGNVTGIDTSMFALRSALVLGNAGDLSLPPPTEPSFTTGVIQNIGVVEYVHATEGIVSINVESLSQLTVNELFALAGTDGTPDSDNPYVTDSDSRLSDERVPVAHASTHVTGGSDVIANATSGSAGLMSAADKSALDGLSSVVVSASASVVVATERYLMLTGQGQSVSLPAGSTGRTVTVIDRAGTATTYPITVTPNGADTILGDDGFIIAANRAAYTFVYASGEWSVI